LYGLPLQPGRAYTWRRFGVLLRGLDHDSRFARTLADLSPDLPTSSGPVDISGWSRTDQLLANIADQLQGANWQRSGGKSPYKPQFQMKPKRSSAPKSTTLTDAQIRERLARRGPQGQEQP
jgi:hypothetical protein